MENGNAQVFARSEITHRGDVSGGYPTLRAPRDLCPKPPLSLSYFGLWRNPVVMAGGCAAAPPKENP